MQPDQQGPPVHGGPEDVPAIWLLLQRHRQLRELVHQFRHAPAAHRPAVASQLLDQLDAHGKLEREVLYPAVRLYGGPDLREALAQRVEEHGQLERRQREIAGGGAQIPGSGAWEELLRSLEAHMEAEEQGFFPAVARELADRLPALAAELERGREEFTFDYDDVVEGTFPASDPPATMAAPRVRMPSIYRPWRS